VYPTLYSLAMFVYIITAITQDNFCLINSEIAKIVFIQQMKAINLPFVDLFEDYLFLLILLEFLFQQ
jgi:hypothetical protein